MEKEREGKGFFELGIVKTVHFVASIMTVLGIFGLGFFVHQEVSSQIKIENNGSCSGDYMISTDEEYNQNTKGATSKSLKPNWNDERDMFFIDEEGFYCIKKLWSKYKNEYYFLWDDENSVAFNKGNLFQIRTKKNNNKEILNEVESIIIVYSNKETRDPVYRMFFPRGGEDKNLVGFDVDSTDEKLVNRSVSPNKLNVPFFVYGSYFEIKNTVEYMEAGKTASFNYEITFIPNDSNKSDDSVNRGKFLVETPFSLNNSSPLHIGIGVHNNGPCFKIESYKQIEQ